LLGIYAEYRRGNRKDDNDMAGRRETPPEPIADAIYPPILS
jgi:hypothetical protein